MTGVRWTVIDGCSEWFPLDVEFWPVKGRGLRVCRACDRERNRLRQAERRRQNPGVAVEYNRRHRAENREAYNAKRQRRRLERRATDPAYVERQRTYQREWMRAYREKAA